MLTWEAIRPALEALLILCILAGGYYAGYQTAAHKYQAADNTGVIKAQNAVIADVKRSATINTTIGDDYEKTINAIMLKYNTGSLHANGSPCNLPTAPIAPSIPHAVANTDKK